MGKPKPKKIDTPDPREIMRAEAEYNRVNTSGPFGSVSWDGNTQRTQLDPRMEAMAQRMFDLGMQDSERVQTPDFLNTIAGGMMSNVGNRYGVGGKPGVQQNLPTPGINPGAPDFSAQAQQIREMLAGNQIPSRVNRRMK